jgi:lambda family phage portal protein
VTLSGKLGSALDRAISVLAPGLALRRMESRARFGMAATMYKATDPETMDRMGWSFGAAGGKPTPGSWERMSLRDLSRHLIRNNAVAAGAQDTIALNVVGQGLRPQSRLRADRLGISPERAAELQRQAEDVWDEWCGLADAADSLHFDDLQFLAMLKLVEDGELLALPTWADEPWRPWGRCLEFVEADRLRKPGDRKDVPDSGIERGTRGQPLRYWIESGSSTPGRRTFFGVDARDHRGRRRVLHLFRPMRPGQSRGIPYFSSVITRFANLDDFVEAELMAARVAACLAVFVTQQDPMAGAASARLAADGPGQDGQRLQSLSPAMIAYMKAGESINVVDPKRPGDAFAPFVESMLRFIGMALGLPYELLVKDFSKTNYSSARAALLEGRRMFSNWRAWFPRQLNQPMWELVLEEAWLRGRFEARDFYRHKAEYCRAAWIGGGWGWVDPVKEVQSSTQAVAGNLSTLADECAAQGRDWEEVLEQRKREEDRRRELGLPAPAASPTPQPAATEEDADEKDRV